MAIKNKVQVVVYVSPEVLEQADKLLAAREAAGGKTSRSQWVEQAMREKITREKRATGTDEWGQGGADSE